jgi:hypothetical protein
MSQTVDVNVLLYASDTTSRYHARARALVEGIFGGPDIAYLFWPTIVGFLRLATHPAVFSEPLSVQEAVGDMDRMLSLQHIKSPGEGETFWHRYRAVAADAVPSGNLASDAHVVALMRENGVRTIWTHDRDFRRFPGIEVRDPFDET